MLNFNVLSQKSNLFNSFNTPLVCEKMNSELSGFYKKNIKKRINEISKKAKLSNFEKKTLLKETTLQFKVVDRMVENSIGTFETPLGIATFFKINKKDYLIPMATEEASVIAACSKGAKLARVSGGFKTKSTKPIMIGQLQLIKIKNLTKVKKLILKNKSKILKLANSVDPTLVKFGGGAKNIEIRSLKKKTLVIHLLVNVKDAMGANAVNSMCETISPMIENITNEKVRLKILSNLAVHRTAKAKAIWLEKNLGKEVIRKIIEAHQFAELDSFRAVTHNKGIMNGIAALTMATGNDYRAIEAGCHGFACLKGTYEPLTKYYKDKKGNLVGEIEIPVQFGLIGGATKIMPKAQIALKILGVKSSQELGEIAAAVGLSQNFAALNALATEGIQKGHMKLHAKNLATMAGAKGKEIDTVAKKIVNSGKATFDEAKHILKHLRKNDKKK